MVLAVFLLWTGKWHRRSGCMTGAEWMTYRFGDGTGGQAARIACAVSEVVFTVGMLTYMAKGVGLFLAMFLLEPLHLEANFATSCSLTSLSFIKQIQCFSPRAEMSFSSSL